MVYDPLDIHRARGTQRNDAGRFEPYARVEEPDGWDIPEERARLKTEVRIEQARKIIARNTSPDLPFDRSINPYRGCEHGCIYCFARPTHTYLGYSAGLDFETRLVAKPNAPERLARELSTPGYRPKTMAIGTNTDPYQPIESHHGIMRGCLEVLREFNHPVAIVTKGALVARDLDILAPMARKGLAKVAISVTSLDAGLSRKMEPRAPTPARRLAAIGELAAAGVPVGVMVAPVVPALTDHELERIMTEAREAGALTASWIMLRLPFEVSGLFRDWLTTHVPDRAGRVMARIREARGGADYDAQWGKRMRGEGTYAQLIAHRFRVAHRRLEYVETDAPLRDDLFAVPPRAGDQLSLF